MLNPEIWIIQKDYKKLELALKSIDKYSYNNYLYTNCISQFNFSEVNMSSKNFNTFFYCQDTNTCIVFMKDSVKELELAKQYMFENEIFYHEISFKNEPEDIINRFPHTLHDHEKNSKEIWIINNRSDLNTLLGENLKKQQNKITYYPLIDSNIILKYTDNNDKEYQINKFTFAGVIVTQDKILLIPKTADNKDLANFAIKNICESLGAKCATIQFNKPKFINNEEKRNKNFEADYILSKILDY